MKKQEEFLQEVLELKKENPDAEIHFCIDSDEILEYVRTVHKITSVVLCPWFANDERILTDVDEIKELFAEQGTDFMTDDEVNKLVAERYEKEVKTAICVFTHIG